MSSQRYERVTDNDVDDIATSLSSPHAHTSIPNSPPPSFRSRNSSLTGRRRPLEQDPLVSDADRTLADTFDSPSDDESDNENSHTLDARQRVLSGRPTSPTEASGEAEEQSDRPTIQRRVTQLPGFTAPGTRVYGGGNSVHDGVFANLSAKPERGEDVEEKPPSYEVAAADATPPYWETTILAPGGTHNSDSVFIDGLPVGSIFSFVWNGLISLSFQLVGFLLTYLLHTTHAAKNGSKAGLGITLIQYGFSLRTAPGPDDSNAPPGQPTPGADLVAAPVDPNSHNFDPTALASTAASALAADAAASAAASNGGFSQGMGLQASDWIAYILMIVGWFILIRAISEYLKARRHEALVLQSPTRGLGVPVVGEGEVPADSV